MVKFFRKKIARVIIILLLITLSLGTVSYIVARRKAYNYVALLEQDVWFYRQYLLLNYTNPWVDWSGPAWVVRYQEDILSGFTLDVRVSVFGNFINANFDTEDEYWRDLRGAGIGVQGDSERDILAD